MSYEASRARDENETISGNGEPIVCRAAGRDWTHQDIHRVRAVWSDPKYLTKDIERLFGIGHRSLGRKQVRAVLGLPPRPAHGGNNSRGKIGVPKGTSRIIRRFIDILNREGADMKNTCAKAGKSTSLIFQWKTGARSPNIVSFETVLNVLGYKLQIVEMDGGEE